MPPEVHGDSDTLPRPVGTPTDRPPGEHTWPPVPERPQRCSHGPLTRRASRGARRGGRGISFPAPPRKRTPKPRASCSQLSREGPLTGAGCSAAQKESTSFRSSIRETQTKQTEDKVSRWRVPARKQPQEAGFGSQGGPDKRPQAGRRTAGYRSGGRKSGTKRSGGLHLLQRL